MIAAWLMSILGVAVIGTLIDLLLPSKRISKFIKSVFRAMVVLIIILPLPGLLRNGFNFTGDGSIFDQDVNLDENFLIMMDNIRMRNLARGVERQLAQEGYSGVGIEITGRWINNDAEISLVMVNLSNLVIDGDTSHIHVSESIRSLVSELLFIERSAIIVL